MQVSKVVQMVPGILALYDEYNNQHLAYQLDRVSLQQLTRQVEEGLNKSHPLPDLSEFKQTKVTYGFIYAMDVFLLSEPYVTPNRIQNALQQGAEILEKAVKMPLGAEPDRTYLVVMISQKIANFIMDVKDLQEQSRQLVDDIGLAFAKNVDLVVPTNFLTKMRGYSKILKDEMIMDQIHMDWIG